MTEAIFGLLGVVVGSVIAWLTEIWLSQRVVLARELKHADWQSVGATYDALSSPQRTTAGENYVDDQYARAMRALEPLASRHRFWWQRLWAWPRRIVGKTSAL
jgi:hypothetical protein